MPRQPGLRRSSGASTCRCGIEKTRAVSPSASIAVLTFTAVGGVRLDVALLALLAQAVGRGIRANGRSARPDPLGAMLFGRRNTALPGAGFRHGVLCSA